MGKIPVLIVSLMLTFGGQVSGARLVPDATIESSQQQSVNRALSFGDGRFFIDGKVPQAFTDFDFLYLSFIGYYTLLYSALLSFPSPLLPPLLSSPSPHVRFQSFRRR